MATAMYGSVERGSRFWPAGTPIPDELRYIEGAWHVATFVSDGYQPFTPRVPIFIQIDTQCYPGAMNVRCRLYNMTAVEVVVDNTRSGIVLQRQKAFQSNFMPLRHVAMLDYLLQSMIENLQVVRHIPEESKIILSDHVTTVEAYRNPQGEMFCGSDQLSETSIELLDFAVDYLTGEPASQWSNSSGYSSIGEDEEEAVASSSVTVPGCSVSRRRGCCQ